MAVWLQLTELYGASFLASFGEEPSPLWSTAIDSLSDEELAAGFTRLIQKPREFAPNLPQFINLCRPPPEPVRYLGVPLTDEQKRQLALPRPPVDPEIRARALASMRKTLGVE